MSSISNGACPIHGTDVPFVTSMLYAMAYGGGENEALVEECVKNGIGSTEYCMDLAERVGNVAILDFGLRGMVCGLGMMHGAYGLGNLVGVYKKPTVMGKVFCLCKSSLYFSTSALELFMAFGFPVATIESHGKLTMMDIPPLAKL